MTDYPSFSDFASSGRNLTGDKIPIAHVLNEKILVRAYRLIPSRYRPERECAQIQFDLNGEEHITFTTSGVLISQLREYDKNLPFYATIRQEGKYFTFS